MNKNEFPTLLNYSTNTIHEAQLFNDKIETKKLRDTNEHERKDASRLIYSNEAQEVNEFYGTNHENVMGRMVFVFRVYRLTI